MSVRELAGSSLYASHERERESSQRMERESPWEQEVPSSVTLPPSGRLSERLAHGLVKIDNPEVQRAPHSEAASLSCCLLTKCPGAGGCCCCRLQQHVYYSGTRM
jgi:hypothetical protein